MRRGPLACAAVTLWQRAPWLVRFLVLCHALALAQALYALREFAELDRAVRIVLIVRIALVHPLLGGGLLALRDWARKLQIASFVLFALVAVVLAVVSLRGAGPGATGPMVAALGVALAVSVGFIRALSAPRLRAHFQSGDSAAPPAGSA